MGFEVPIIDDGLQYPIGKKLDAMKKLPKETIKPIDEGTNEINSPSATFVHKQYNESDGSVLVDIYIEEGFYDNNTAELDQF